MDTFNEEFFIDFFQQNGYTQIHPETLSISEQICLWNNAEKVACTAGSITHMALFANPNLEQTLLIRHNQPGALRPQFLINQFSNVLSIWIDVSMSFLPTQHASGCYLLGPTEDFENFIYSYYEVTGHTDVPTIGSSVVMDYLKGWIDKYTKSKYAFNYIKDLDSFDFLNCMSKSINGDSLNRKNFQSKSKTQLKNEIVELNQKIAEDAERYNSQIKRLNERIATNSKKHRTQIAEIKNSNSWKIGRAITWLPRTMKRLLR